MKKKTHKQPATIVMDARVLELPGPRPGVVVTVPLMLLPAWYEFHKLEPVQYDKLRELLIVKRLK